MQEHRQVVNKKNYWFEENQQSLRQKQQEQSHVNAQCVVKIREQARGHWSRALGKFELSGGCGGGGDAV